MPNPPRKTRKQSAWSLAAQELQQQQAGTQPDENAEEQESTPASSQPSIPAITQESVPPTTQSINPAIQQERSSVAPQSFTNATTEVNVPASSQSAQNASTPDSVAVSPQPSSSAPSEVREAGSPHAHGFAQTPERIALASQPENTALPKESAPPATHSQVNATTQSGVPVAPQPSISAVQQQGVPERTQGTQNAIQGQSNVVAPQSIQNAGQDKRIPSSPQSSQVAASQLREETPARYYTSAEEAQRALVSSQTQAPAPTQPSVIGGLQFDQNALALISDLAEKLSSVDATLKKRNKRRTRLEQIADQLKGVLDSLQGDNNTKEDLRYIAETRSQGRLNQGVTLLESLFAIYSELAGDISKTEKLPANELMEQALISYLPQAFAQMLEARQRRKKR